MRFRLLFRVILSLCSSINTLAFSVESKLLREVKMSKLYSSFSDEFIQKQKESSNRNGSTFAGKIDTIDEHLFHQEKVFDDLADFFNTGRATAPEIETVLDNIIEKALHQMMKSSTSSETNFSIMDVGSGSGALFPHYLRIADKLGIQLNITAVDLSEKMTKYGQKNADKYLSSYNNHHFIRCITGDFVDLVTGQKQCRSDITGFSSGIMNKVTEKFQKKYDAVVINACYGNFFDSDSLMNAGAVALKSGGIMVISHPLGSDFVKDLHEHSPDTVPTLLPSSEALQGMINQHGFSITQFIDGSFEIGEGSTSLFYASLEKLPFRILRSSVRLRGRVNQGYGRGGKKLGFPTANLPSSLFHDALSLVPTGIYFGYALVEGHEQKYGRNMVHKAVVNVGYSPTFQGEENKEKIVEAHLIVNDGDIKGDFYGEMMRLVLYGFLRPEMKFSSFSDLVAAITNDVATAKVSLDLNQFSEMKANDAFLREYGTLWIGSSGGNADASYEFDEKERL